MKILLIEENEQTAHTISHNLRQKGFHIECVDPDENIRECVLLGLYDLLIADKNHTSADILGIIRDLKAKDAQKPVILLGSSDSVSDRIIALNAGADYLLSSAVCTEELLACTNALLRRLSPVTSSELAFGDISLDPGTATLHCKEESVRLSRKEMDLMKYLLQTGEKNIAKEVLLARVWGYETSAIGNHVEVYMGFLRRKLEAIHSDVSIVSTRKAGYHLEAKPE